MSGNTCGVCRQPMLGSHYHEEIGPIPRDEAMVVWHFERGEGSVRVVRADNWDDVYGCAWEDADLAGLIEDGFIDVRGPLGYDGPRVGREAADASVLDYAQSLGLILP